MRITSVLQLATAACLTLMVGCDDDQLVVGTTLGPEAGAPPAQVDGGIVDATPALDGAPEVDGGGLDTQRSAPLKIVTFNIRYDNPADGVNAWPVRREMVYRLFREMDADLAGLQEVYINQLQDLLAALPGYQRVGVGRNDGRDSGEFSPILYRASRFEVESSGTFWFSDTPEVPGSASWGNYTTRICTWGRFVEKGTGRAHYLFNIHLDNLSQVSREKSVVLLMQRIGARAVPGDPFIVTGDFNARETEPAIGFMKGAVPIEGLANPLPLVDPFRALYPDATGVGTFHNFLGGSDSPKIDYIFIRPADRGTASEIILKNESGLYPSDHYPVTATVELAGW